MVKLAKLRTSELSGEIISWCDVLFLSTDKAKPRPLCHSPLNSGKGKQQEAPPIVCPSTLCLASIIVIKAPDLKVHKCPNFRRWTCFGYIRCECSIQINIICSFSAQILHNSVGGASQCSWTMIPSRLKQPEVCYSVAQSPELWFTCWGLTWRQLQQSIIRDVPQFRLELTADSHQPNIKKGMFDLQLNVFTLVL